MKITINEKEYSFSFRGFGPQYTYETITGESYRHGPLRNLHLLLYATLVACNVGSFTMSINDFTAWLYEHPADEEAMAQAINEECERRVSLSAKKKE